MKDIDFFRKNLIALTLVAGVALAGCDYDNEGTVGDEALGDDGLGQAGQVETGQPEQDMETREMAQQMGAAAPFSQLDADTNDQVTQQEFQTYAREQGVFERWDEDGDGLLGQDEFDGIGFDEGVADFEAWDENDDGELGSDEFYGSFFGAFDENEDGHWDAGDWDDAGDSGFFDI